MVTTYPMDPLKTTADNDCFAKSVGIKLTAVARGYARAELILNDSHLNGLGTAHGGVVFTLADLAFAAAANAYGVDAMAINISISYFKAVRSGKLIAEARELSLNRKLATYAVTVTDDAGQALAAFQGTAYRKTTKAPIQPE
jgi:acyl-CoA thioesterase